MPQRPSTPIAPAARAAIKVAAANASEALPGIPRWCPAFIGIRPDERQSHESGGLEVARSARGAILSAVIRDAVSLNADALEARVAEVYGQIAALLGAESCSGAAGGGLHPVRFWNFIPAIHETMRKGSGLIGETPAEISRYMVFNAGRFKAIERWRSVDAARGSPLGGGIAAATGVGHAGRDLAIHCLALDRTGLAVENPRQVPAYRYSRRYGPLPPCFARGTVVDSPAGRVLLVGGTASVRGEESIHAGDAGRMLAPQVRETLANIASLIDAGLNQPVGEEPDLRPIKAFADEGSQRRCLRTLTDVRVYHARAADRREIAGLLATRLDAGAKVEYVRADICRPELLVEIEGVAGGTSPDAQ